MTRPSLQSLRVGDVLPERAAPEIVKSRIVDIMTVMDDCNPVHVDEELVKRLGLRGLVNQGPANLAYITNMLAAWTGDADCLRRFKVRFHVTVVPGDDLVAGGKVTDIRPDGQVDCDVWLKLRDGTVMLSGMATVALAAAAAGA
ncbi:MAG TPA: MaoC/PaaZ C-terminal domain-containing protein [Ramlibacter sp.]|nr:MaoC/PaaZ C-terminal domain-containing protein [Ramlibacter sp.]